MIQQILSLLESGVNKIYDGSFSGKLISGQGVFVELLKQNGIKAVDVEDLQ